MMMINAAILTKGGPSADPMFFLSIHEMFTKVIRVDTFLNDKDRLFLLPDGFIKDYFGIISLHLFLSA